MNEFLLKWFPIAYDMAYGNPQERQLNNWFYSHVQKIYLWIRLIGFIRVFKLYTVCYLNELT